MRFLYKILAQRSVVNHTFRRRERYAQARGELPYLYKQGAVGVAEQGSGADRVLAELRRVLGLEQAGFKAALEDLVEAAGAAVAKGREATRRAGAATRKAGEKIAEATDAATETVKKTARRKTPPLSATTPKPASSAPDAAAPKPATKPPSVPKPSPAPKDENGAADS
jgi:hypothetical protein